MRGCRSLSRIDTVFEALAENGMVQSLVILTDALIVNVLFQVRDYLAFKYVDCDDGGFPFDEASGSVARPLT